MQKGCISIDTENIFPIIKKWLYSDKDIFIRELISNGCDAISKYKRLVSLGEVKQSEDEKYKITVSVSKKNKTIKFDDNGILELTFPKEAEQKAEEMKYITID